MTEFKPVVFSADCNEDGDCPVCAIPYEDCDCIGPTEDDVEYKFVNGIMYGKRTDYDNAIPGHRDLL